MRRAWLACVLVAASLLHADTGVIIPSDRQSPDPNELSIESLALKIEIDNGHATVHWNEVFHNKTGRVLEGNFVLTLPGGAAVSNFAVWDDLTRIPGVLLERKRAGELYNQIRNETIDPGLLESGEISESNAPGQARHSTQFSVKIVPIPAYGYKRIEAEYRQLLPVDDLSSELIVPLQSSPAQRVPKLAIELNLRNPHGITSYESPGYDLTLSTHAPDQVSGRFGATDLKLARDFILRYRVADESAPRVQAYRDAATGEPGVFEASSILAHKTSVAKADAKTVIVLFDTSLSMQWEKLERSFQALEAVLESLAPSDRFNVLVFNSEVTTASPNPVAASAASVAKALDFVRSRPLKGGTNLQEALEAALRQSSPDTYIVSLSDGGVTEGVIAPARFREWFAHAWSASKKPHMYMLAIGDDADVRLLRYISAHSGIFEQIGSTEPLDFKLKGFIRKIGLAPLSAVDLNISPQVEPNLVYRVETENFPGTRASWVGQYANPGTAEVEIAGERSRVIFPENETDHPALPAAWARARVDALLQKIDREGEDKASIDEIIALSRKYHFVTPYTSFLAAPRALLRPRLIRPGDPLLRVRTDPSVTSVVALFPFGLVKPLRYLKSGDIWQTRFVATPDLPDGVHTVRLILRDRAGHTYREHKTFIISSRAPNVRVHLAVAAVHAGSRVPLRVEASQTTRTIAVRLYGAPPLLLNWNEAEKYNVGTLIVPPGMPAGRYSLHVIAEDIAHNVSQQEVPLEVLP